ncbi:hypothetical protein J4Q44_G00224920 [Coregonus suidteri]|uniref:Integrase catalytic domain-containing protein n=1 Tax=Coregonus suidteri TaxID=861788 RepID=A0AAN8L9T5_9TELE
MDAATTNYAEFSRRFRAVFDHPPEGAGGGGTSPPREDVQRELACRDTSLTFDQLVDMAIRLDTLLATRGRPGGGGSPIPLSSASEPSPMELGGAGARERRRRSPRGPGPCTNFFQSFVDEIFRDMQGQGVVVYIDDILVYSPTRVKMEGGPVRLRWSAEADRAFGRLKDLFTSAPVFGASGSLFTLSPAERNYDVGDRELLAVVQALKITYIPGSQNGKADALSRRYDAEERSVESTPILPESCLVAPVVWEVDGEIERALRTDPSPPQCPVGRTYVPLEIRDRLICSRRPVVSFLMPGLPTALQTAEALFTHVFRHYGVPEDIVSDRGPQFTSRPVLAPWHESQIEAPAVDEWVRRSEETWDAAHVHLQRAIIVDRRRASADLHRSEGPVYAPGDRVWLSTRNLPLRLPCRKLGRRPVVAGPLQDFEIEETPPPPLDIEGAPAEAYKAIYETINCGEKPLPITKVFATSWLSIEPAVSRILDQWEELRLNFAVTKSSEHCYMTEVYENTGSLRKAPMVTLTLRESKSSSSSSSEDKGEKEKKEEREERRGEERQERDEEEKEEKREGERMVLQAEVNTDEASSQCSSSSSSIIFRAAETSASSRWAGGLTLCQGRPRKSSKRKDRLLKLIQLRDRGTTRAELAQEWQQAGVSASARTAEADGHVTARPVPAPRTKPVVRVASPARPVPAPRTKPVVRVPIRHGPCPFHSGVPEQSAPPVA